ncbi:hypothetical protein GOBAR_AA12605 [Gossypium barbadense]|uniref:Transposase MuDR plant domain-containing protein n=1 Tax=Gossypium barbadense TaxID=3634 RepID=A0A2P5XXJ2_GOSBA|nr:hypothetical protein GOBAR_AA12605 [Gossypium barbadense]
MDNPSPVELFVEIAELDPIQVSHHNPNDDFSNTDLDDIPEDIDEEDLVEGENVNPHSTGNTGLGIVIRNNPGSFMTNVDPDAALARKFLEYTNIVSTHLLDKEFDGEELFVGQQFNNKKGCLHAIKKFSLKLACSSRVNTADTNVDDKENRKSTHMHVCSYVARPSSKVRCKNHMQLHHPFSERLTHHSGVGPYCGHVSSIQVQSPVPEGIMDEANSDVRVV